MLPKSLALVEDDPTYSEYVARHLSERGVRVLVYGDAHSLLAAHDGLQHDFYVVDLTLPGMDGVALIEAVRRHSDAGVLVVSGRTEQHVFRDVVKAGADMYLAKPVSFEQVVTAIEAVHRRSRKSLQGTQPWRLDIAASELVAPDSTRIGLSEGDLVVLKSLANSPDRIVSREALCESLGYEPGESATSALNAAIFRLRRRIERATSAPAPLHARSRMGYEFRGPLSVV
jgi:two-component system, OmpR family, response regulator